MNKFKEIVFVLVMIIIILAICFGVVVASPGWLTKQVSWADSTPKYQVNFNYEAKYKYNTTTSTIDSGTSSSLTMQTYQSTYYKTSISMYGDSSSGTGTFNSGDYIKSTNVNIIVDEAFATDSITITNSSGQTVSQTASNSISLSGLNQGKYTFTYQGNGQVFTINSRGSGQYKGTLSFDFIVDTLAPDIVGASSSIVGCYKNSTFIVNANDSGCGLNKFYYKGPSQSSFSSTTSTSITINGTDENGLYTFYAVDNLGNASSNYFVYLDSSKPTGVFKNKDNQVISSQYTKTPFYLTASDIGAGVKSIKVLKPNSSEYESYTDGTIISEDGLYKFKIEDNAGNESIIYSITLDKLPPIITFTSNGVELINNGSTKYSVRVASSDATSNVKAMYVKEPGESEYTICSATTTFSENGKYYVYAVDNAGNSSASYSFIIDTIKPDLIVTNSSFSCRTNEDFMVTATDNISIVYLYVKRPLSSDYVKCSESSCAISSLDEDGKYYFYAEDYLGNQSDVKWVELIVNPTVPTITTMTNSTKVKLSWDGTCTALLNNEPYEEGTWIGEGDYEFKLTNASNRTYTTTFSVDHNYELVETINPTCEVNGYSLYRCSLCGDEYYENYVTATGHKYDKELVLENCEHGSYYHYTCSVCFHEYDGEPFTEGGHIYNTQVIDPTCLERGFTRYICTRCDYSYIDDYVDALGHNYRIEDYEATCLIGGHKHYICKECGFDYYGDYVDALGHDFQEYREDPTCTDDGSTVIKCSRCGLEESSSILEHTGHEMTEETIFVSCTENGCVRHICTKCGMYYDTDVIYCTGHSYVSEITKQPTCDETGIRINLCTKCGYKEEKVIPALGHNYDVKDYEQDGQIYRDYVCLTCGVEYQEEIEENYEEVTSYVEYLFNQYRPYMMYVLIATSGVWSIGMGVAIIIAKRHDEKEKAIKMVKNYILGIIIIFVVLMGCPYLINAVASLV